MMADLSSVSPVRSARSAAQPTTFTAGSGRRHAASDLAEKSLPQLVSLVAELSSQPPPLDRARIAEIRAAISSGHYAIDPRRIAAALLGDGETGR